MHVYMPVLYCIYYITLYYIVMLRYIGLEERLGK